MRVRVIHNDCGEPYMVRLTFLDNRFFSLKLHIILRSDDDRALHDHPWWFVTWILVNGYIEHTEHGVFVRKPEQKLFRPAKFAHRVEIKNPAVSLVLTGPRSREWGFFTKAGWVEWFNFKSNRDC